MPSRDSFVGHRVYGRLKIQQADLLVWNLVWFRRLLRPADDWLWRWLLDLSAKGWPCLFVGG